MYIICPYKICQFRNFFQLLAKACPLVAATSLYAQVTVEEGAKDLPVAPDAKVEKLGGDMKFTEGPVWVKAKKKLIFSDIPNSRLMEWTKEGGVKEYRKSESSNGNILDGNGLLLSAQHAGRNVVRENADGSISVVIDSFEGKKFNSPNDLAVKADGSIWFTDPPYGLPKDQQKELDGNYVFRFDPSTKKITIVSKEFNMPNGIVFSPDEKRLYIADSGKPGRVGAFDVQPDHTLSAAVWWTEGGADGIRVDTKGNLFTTASDGVRIYSPDGKKLATIAVPEGPANCNFGGEDNKTLFITAKTSLYAVPVLNPGVK